MRGLEVDRAKPQVVERDAVDHVVDGFLAVAGGVDGESAAAANGYGRGPVLRRRHRTRDEQPQVEEVAPIERDLLNHPLVDHMADGHR